VVGVADQAAHLVSVRNEQARQPAGDLAVPAGDGYEHRAPALNARRRA
jgi:hypothetical protein